MADGEGDRPRAMRASYGMGDSQLLEGGQAPSVHPPPNNDRLFYAWVGDRH